MRYILLILFLGFGMGCQTMKAKNQGREGGLSPLQSDQKMKVKEQARKGWKRVDKEWFGMQAKALDSKKNASKFVEANLTTNHNRKPSSAEKSCELLAKHNQAFCVQNFLKLKLNRSLIEACSYFLGEDDWNIVNQKLCLEKAYKREPSSDTIQLCLREEWGGNERECAEKANFEEIKACASINGFVKEVSCMDLSSQHNVGLDKIKTCGEAEKFKWDLQKYCLINARALRLERIKTCGTHGRADYRLQKECMESPLSNAKVEACLKDFHSHYCINLLEKSSNADSVTVEHIKACGAVLNDDRRAGNLTARDCLDKTIQVTDIPPEIIRACGAFSGAMQCLEEAYRFNLDPELIRACGGRDPQQRGDNWGWQWFCIALELNLNVKPLEACKKINFEGDSLRACFEYAYGKPYSRPYIKGLSMNQVEACGKGWPSLNSDRKLLCLKTAYEKKVSASKIEQCGKKDFWFEYRYKNCLVEN